MKTYKIFKNPQGRYEAVKQGWSWPGFLFGVIWACVKRMWGLGLGLIAAMFVLVVFALLVYGDTPAMDQAFNALGLAISIWFGAKGNSLREQNLRERGYTAAEEIIEAKNPEAAVAHYIAAYEQTRH